MNKIRNPEALLRWLVNRQVRPPPFSPDDSDESDAEDTPQSLSEGNILIDDSAGFQGREGKDTDACYSFWCSASLKVSTLRPDPCFDSSRFF